MKRTVAVVNGNGSVECIREDIPELKEHEVLIKVHASLISPGTEMALVKRLTEKPDPNFKPFHFGYSNAGEIIAVKGDVKGLQVGMRVAAMGGGATHTNYACVPVNLVVPIPDNVTYEQATYLSLAATALQAVRRTRPALGEYGAVMGLGIVGNIAAQLYQISGARVAGRDGYDSRLTTAKACGIREAGNFKCEDSNDKIKEFAKPYGLDFALFAFGGNAEKAYEGIRGCMKVSADGHQMGRVVLVGGCRIPIDGGATNGNLDILISSRTGAGYHDNAWEYGQDYPNAFVQFTTQRNAIELINLIAEKRLLVDPLTTHHFALDQTKEATDMILQHPDQTLGVILTMSHND